MDGSWWGTGGGGISCRGQELINQIIKTDSRGGGRRIAVKGRSEKGKRRLIEAPGMIPPPPPTDPPTAERRQRPDGEGERDELNSPASGIRKHFNHSLRGVNTYHWHSSFPSAFLFGDKHNTASHYTGGEINLQTDFHTWSAPPVI